MVVPEGAVPGTKLQYAAPDGQELRLTVPDGVPPGSVMTLTQDPVSKQWRCMAEPADPEPAPAPVPQPAAQYQQQQVYLPQQQQQQQPQPLQQAPPPQYGGATYVVGGQPHGQPHMMAYGGAPGATLGSIPGQMYGNQHMPVNLSYVPPPAANSATVGMPPGQVLVPGQQGSVLQPGAAAAFNPPRQDPGGFAGGENRPSYTPPGHMVENRPSYTPLPHTLPAGTILPNGQVTIDPNQLMGSHQGQVQQRHMVVNQSPSYVPPPMQNSPSYVPPPQGGPMPAGGPVMTASGPSITTMPPQAGMPQHMQHMQPGMPQPLFQPMGPGHSPFHQPQLGMPPQQPLGAPMMHFGHMGQAIGGQGGLVFPGVGAPTGMHPGMHPGMPMPQQMQQPGLQYHYPQGMQPGQPQHMMPGQPMPQHMMPMQPGQPPAGMMQMTPEGMAGMGMFGGMPQHHPGAQHEEL